MEKGQTQRKRYFWRLSWARTVWTSSLGNVKAGRNWLYMKLKGQIWHSYFLIIYVICLSILLYFWISKVIIKFKFISRLSIYGNDIMINILVYCLFALIFLHLCFLSLCFLDQENKYHILVSSTFFLNLYNLIYFVYIIKKY